MNKRWRILLIIVAIVCFGISLSYPVKYKLEEKSTEDSMERLVAMRDAGLAKRGAGEEANTDEESGKESAEESEPQAESERPEGTAPSDFPEAPEQEEATEAAESEEAEGEANEAAPEEAEASISEPVEVAPNEGEASEAELEESEVLEPASEEAAEEAVAQIQEDVAQTVREVASEATPEGEAEVEAEPEGEAEAEPEAEPEVASEPEVSNEPEASAEPEAPAEPEASAEPEAPAEPEASVEPEVSAEPASSAESEEATTAEATAEVTTETSAEATAEATVEVTPEPTPEVTPTPSPTPEPTRTPQPTVYVDRFARSGAENYDEKEKRTLDESKILPQFQEIYAENSDFAGWITIPGTAVDYPVVQTEDSDYYLHHDFFGEKNANGQIILDTKCDPYTPSYNLVISGHSMRSGKMFGRLVNYMDESYWENHKLVYFDTLMDERTYVIFAAFFSADYDVDEAGFRYNADIRYSVDARQWLREVKENELYDTGIDVEFGDEFLTLTTCNKARRSDGRFVVVCRRLREGESFE